MGNLTKQDILALIEEENVKFIRLQFADFFGVLRNIAVTGSQISAALDGHYRIDSFHLNGLNKSACGGICLVPDLSTFAILPWRPQSGKVARLICDLFDEDGNEITESPRFIFRKVLETAKNEGFEFDFRPESEFFLFLKDEEGRPTTKTNDIGNFLDVAPLDSGEDARRDIIFTLEEMGFEMESSHHGAAPAQHVVRFRKTQGVKTADNILTLRNTVRSIAGRHGFHATFMPKPRTDLYGSAMVVKVTAAEGKRDFITGTGPSGLSEEGEMFIAGILSHMPGLTAFACPIVNSYKRLKTRFFSPTELYWSDRDYTAPVKVSKTENGRTRIEWKLPDGASNPYITLALFIAAGLDGIRKQMKLPACDEKIGAIPFELMESLEKYSQDELLVGVTGKRYADIYLKEKESEWEEYAKEVTDWEIRKYLDRI